jgi:hypothetical protein
MTNGAKSETGVALAEPFAPLTGRKASPKSDAVMP